MVIDPHDLHHEFPEFKDSIRILKTSNNHFARLFDEYHRVNNEVVKAEEGAIHMGDLILEGMKKQRLRLKDELHGMLKEHTTS
ncbi:MAG TPA: YdcH family protein [Azospira sp.]|nr:YdcH family protein [Azospira sp.]